MGLKSGNLQYSSEFHDIYEYKYYHANSNNLFSKLYVF